MNKKNYRIILGQLGKFEYGQLNDKEIFTFLRCDNGIMVKMEPALVLRRYMLTF